MTDIAEPRPGNFTLIFKHLETAHLVKDVFLVPYYFGQIHGLNVRIVYPQTESNKNLPASLRGVSLTPIPNRLAINGDPLPSLKYLWFHARQIDVLMRFHLTPFTMLAGILYKRRNPKGFLYVKADGGSEFVHAMLHLRAKPSPRRMLKRLLYSKFLKAVDLITIETKIIREQLKNENILASQFQEKVRLMPNGFDNEGFANNGLKIKDLSEKENIILTVGRIGAHEKNSPMFLQAVQRLNLNGWKVALVGPIETAHCDFQKTIDDFYATNPHLKGKVLFPGPIYDTKRLWEWFNRAKIFVFTSRWETFGLVLNEALWFRNFIVSTDVGAAGQCVERGYGEIVPQENDDYLSKVLQRAITPGYLENLYPNVNWQTADLSWEHRIRQATHDRLQSIQSPS